MPSIRSMLAGLLGLGLATAALAAPDVVLVAGATGATGRPLVGILKEQGFAVRALVRDKAKAADLPAGVEVVEGDVTRPDTLPAAVKGVTFIISTLGAKSPKPPNNPENVDFQGVVNLVDAAKAAGVKHFVLMSSIGAGNADPAVPLNKMFGMVLLWKGKGEDALRASGVPYTIVRPGGLQVCAPGKVGLMIAPGNEAPQGIICRADVALVMADALTNPAANGKTIALVSDKAAPVDAWKNAWAAIPKD
jgi:uncharacterized protein YbjT (DUF2867 family)